MRTLFIHLASPRSSEEAPVCFGYTPFDFLNHDCNRLKERCQRSVKVDTSGLVVDSDCGAEAFRAATANLTAAEGRFLDGETADVLAFAGSDWEDLRAATTKVTASAGAFFAAGAREEVAVGSVLLSPSSPPAAPHVRFTPPRKGTVSQIVKGACSGAVGCATTCHCCKGAPDDAWKPT